MGQKCPIFYSVKKVDKLGLVVFLTFKEIPKWKKSAMRCKGRLFRFKKKPSQGRLKATYLTLTSLRKFFSKWFICSLKRTEPETCTTSSYFTRLEPRYYVARKPNKGEKEWVYSWTLTSLFSALNTRNTFPLLQIVRQGVFTFHDILWCIKKLQSTPSANKFQLCLHHCWHIRIGLLISMLSMPFVVFNPM